MLLFWKEDENVMDGVVEKGYRKMMWCNLLAGTSTVNPLPSKESGSTRRKLNLG